MDIVPLSNLVCLKWRIPSTLGKKVTSLLTEEIWGLTLLRTLYGMAKWEHPGSQTLPMCSEPLWPQQELAEAPSTSSLGHKIWCWLARAQTGSLPFAVHHLLVAPCELLHQAPLQKPQTRCSGQVPGLSQPKSCCSQSSYHLCHHDSLLSVSIPINHVNSCCIHC